MSRGGRGGGGGRGGSRGGRGSFGGGGGGGGGGGYGGSRGYDSICLLPLHSLFGEFCGAVDGIANTFLGTAAVIAPVVAAIHHTKESFLFAVLD